MFEIESTALLLGCSFADSKNMSNMTSRPSNWIDGYNTQKAAVKKYCQPRSSKQADDPESLNRLQVILIWFASVLISVSIFAMIRDQF